MNRRWRSLAPLGGSPLQIRLFQLVLADIESPEDSPYLVPLVDREVYVAYIESKHKIRIPDDYRTVLLQWPISRPPPGTHWPHGLRFFADGFCSCGPEILMDGVCVCEQWEVVTNDVSMQESLLNTIHRGETFDYHAHSEDSRWELFSNPPRLYTDTQNAQTIQFILAHPLSSWTSAGSDSAWTRLSVRALRLSPYAVMATVTLDNKTSEVQSYGDFWMVIEGPCAGQVHAWSQGWYYGFESENFLDWRYEEWDPEFFEKNRGIDRGASDDSSSESEEDP